MSPVYHIWIDNERSQVELSRLSVSRTDLATWLSELYMDYQIEFKIGIL